MEQSNTTPVKLLFAATRRRVRVQTPLDVANLRQTATANFPEMQGVHFSIGYVDEEGDLVDVVEEQDLEEAIYIHNELGRVLSFVLARVSAAHEEPAGACGKDGQDGQHHEFHEPLEHCDVHHDFHAHGRHDNACREPQHEHHNPIHDRHGGHRWGNPRAEKHHGRPGQFGGGNKGRWGRGGGKGRGGCGRAHFGRGKGRLAGKGRGHRFGGGKGRFWGGKGFGAGPHGRHGRFDSSSSSSDSSSSSSDSDGQDEGDDAVGQARKQAIKARKQARHEAKQARKMLQKQRKNARQAAQEARKAVKKAAKGMRKAVKKVKKERKKANKLVKAGAGGASEHAVATKQAKMQEVVGAAQGVQTPHTRVELVVTLPPEPECAKHVSLQE